MPWTPWPGDRRRPRRAAAGAGRRTPARGKDRDGALGGGCAFADGVLYVVTGLAEAMALDPADGRSAGGSPCPGRRAGRPTVAGGRIFVPTIENQLLALSAENGERQWTYRGQPVVTMSLGLPAPAVEGEVVVAGFGSGELAAIRANDGRLIWTETLTSVRGGAISDIAAITALPVIDRGRVLAAGWRPDHRARPPLRPAAVGARPGGGRDPRAGGRRGLHGQHRWRPGLLRRDDGRVRWVRALGRFEDRSGGATHHLGARRASPAGAC